MALQPWDTLTVDMQHGLIGYQAALELIRVLGGRGKGILARVPWLEPSISMKLLDAGAEGLICPMISTPQDAARFVSCCRYPPVGIRSFGPTRAGLLTADYADCANEDVVCAVQIEDSKAVDALEEIAAVDGLDMLYVGPADLALSLGHPPKFDPYQPDLIAIFERVVAACEANGLIAAIHCGQPAYAARMASMGFRFVTVGSDLRLLAAASNSTATATQDAISAI
jgi:4-hydroxy-2-oxoheptanedioate aldolase